MAASYFDTNHELFADVNTFISALKGDANLTAGEQAELTRIDARTIWRPRDINSFLRITGDSLRRKSGT